VTITEDKAQPHAATIVEGPTHPARSPRRRSWRKVATWAVACSAVVLAAGGYLAVHQSSEPAAVRARSADSARLQGQADASAAPQPAAVRARSADSARLQGQADASAAPQPAAVRARSADSARLQGQADASAAQLRGGGSRDESGS
jgi:hypothetical protein